MRIAVAVALGLALAGGLVVQSGLAQPAGSAPPTGGQAPAHGAGGHAGHHHGMHAMHHPPAGTPGMPGQDAFGAIAEVVSLLDADPATDWAKVDLERLRQHLIDMNEVVLRSEVSQAAVPGGLVMTVTGTGRTEKAIQAMVVPHSAELDRMLAYSAKAEVIPGGVRLTVVSKTPDDARSVARLRGLGFPGLLAEGAHHGPHHLAMARGERGHGHRH
jgi:hypothetical protein